MLQLVRFAVVGLVSNITGYLLYVIITFAGAEPKRAMTLLYAVGAVIGYIGNRQWTFSHKATLSMSVMRYALAHIFGYLLNLLILITFVDRLGYPHQWIQAIAIFVVAAFLFVVFKWFVFLDVRRDDNGAA